MDKRERKISENIRIERLKQHYTQEEFSEEIGISTNFLYRIEAGTASMSLKTLLRIQEALGIDGNTLLGKSELSSTPKYFDEILHILSDCNEQETFVLMEILRYLKITLKKIYV